MGPRRIPNTDHDAELLNLGNTGQHYINRNYPNVRAVPISPYANPRPLYTKSYPYQGYHPLSRKKHRIEHISSTLSSTQATIKDSVISVDALEEFHKNNIQLTHLVLTNSAILVSNEYTLPTDIQPCRSLKSLVLDRDSEIWDKNCISMDYIIAKYPNLTHLEFLIRIVSDNYVEYANVLGRTFPEMRPTNTYGYGAGSYDHRKEAPNYFKDFYKEGGKRFLSNLPKTLQVLKINAAIFKKPIESMRESGINPAELVFYAFSNSSAVGEAKDMFDDILCSTQATQYIQELPCLETLRCSLGLDMEVFNKGEMTSNSIKHFTIGIESFNSNKKLSLDKVLIAFPSLEELLIPDEVCSITAAPITNNQPIYPNFRVLQMIGSYDTNALKFMRASLPNIRVLERMFKSDIHEYPLYPERVKPVRDGCIYHGWRGRLSKNTIKRYTIDLTGFNLDIFHLKTKFSHIRGDFEAKLYLKINSGSTAKAYSLIITSGGLRDVKLASEIVETYDINVPNRITINCDHIGTFKFNNYVVFETNK